MPSKWTFTIKPIKKLVDIYVGDGKGWIDPFAGMNSPAEITNDLNPEMPAKYHLEALEFVQMLNGNSYKGCIFDPPYSLTQVSRSYNDLGISYSKQNKLDPTASFPNVKNEVSKKILTGGYIINCGWNSNGFGKKRGFEIVEILLVAHGGGHNDTIVTVEQKVNYTLDSYASDSSDALPP